MLFKEKSMNRARLWDPSSNPVNTGSGHRDNSSSASSIDRRAQLLLFLWSQTQPSYDPTKHSREYCFCSLLLILLHFILSIYALYVPPSEWQNHQHISLACSHNLNILWSLEQIQGEIEGDKPQRLSSKAEFISYSFMRWDIGSISCSE